MSIKLISYNTECVLNRVLNIQKDNLEMQEENCVSNNPNIGLLPKYEHSAKNDNKEKTQELFENTSYLFFETQYNITKPGVYHLKNILLEQDIENIETAQISAKEYNLKYKNFENEKIIIVNQSFEIKVFEMFEINSNIDELATFALMYKLEDKFQSKQTVKRLKI